MNVLLIGSGGREHSLAWAISKSPKLGKLFCVPGNGGISAIADCQKLDLTPHQNVIDFCRLNSIDFVVIGPEAPLVDGLADSLEAENIKVFGPTKAASQLEGSKGFTKDLCAKYNIPTAAYGRFSEAEAAKDYVKQQGAPIVIKADGLAAGKGVIMAETLDQALDAIDQCFSGQFGEAGAEVVVEEWLMGEEASFFALVDGTTALPLATAQDHKRAFDGDKGPNTGGMGAYSPAPVMTADLCQKTMEDIIFPTVKAMNVKGMPYKGVLYAGLMITATGPQLIEYNVRFGDPECQVLMMRLNSDILPALQATTDGTLSDISLEWSGDVALTVVMASQGYPGSYEKNTVIENLDEAGMDENIFIFHAGTSKSEDGQILASGGRVLNVTAKGASVKEAHANAYDAAKKIKWDEGFCRSDIGWRAIER